MIVPSKVISPFITILSFKDGLISIYVVASEFIVKFPEIVVVPKLFPGVSFPEETVTFPPMVPPPPRFPPATVTLPAIIVVPELD